MLVDEEVINELIKELYEKKLLEYKQWVCKRLDAECHVSEGNVVRPFDSDGYIDKLSTGILATKSYNVGKYAYNKAKYFIYFTDIKYAVIVGFEFNKWIIKEVKKDPYEKIILLTVKELMKENAVSDLHRKIEEIDNPTKLSKFFPSLKK